MLENIDSVIKNLTTYLRKTEHTPSQVSSEIEKIMDETIVLLESTTEKKDIEKIVKKLTHKFFFSKSSPIDLINEKSSKENNGHLLFLKNLILDKIQILTENTILLSENIDDGEKKLKIKKSTLIK